MTQAFVSLKDRGPDVKPKLSLLDIGETALRIQDALFESVGELTPELEASLDSLLEQGTEALDAAAWVARRLTGEAETCREEAKRYQERAASFERNVENLKGRMLFAVDAAFSGKLKTIHNTIWGQTSPDTIGFEVAADVDLAKIAETDSELVRRRFELDKLALKNRYEAGDVIPDGILVQHNPGKRSLRIR